MGNLVSGKLFLFKQQVVDKIAEKIKQMQPLHSSMGRKKLDIQLRIARYEQMETAAWLLRDEYCPGGIMDLSSLDGEDIVLQ